MQVVMGVINQIMTMIELETSSEPDLSSTDLSNDLHCAKGIYFLLHLFQDLMRRWRIVVHVHLRI